MADVLDPAFDPVGIEVYCYGEGVVVAANHPADGMPARLALLRGGRAFVPHAMPPRPERGDVLLDESPSGSEGYQFPALPLTPDASRLAVLRHGGIFEGVGNIVVCDTATGEVLWTSPLPIAEALGSTLVWSDAGELVLVLPSHREGGGVTLRVHEVRP